MLLDNDALFRRAPAVFAKAPHEKMSDAYRFIPTIEVVDALRSEGWFPIRASQTNSRSPLKWDTGSHNVRFRRDGLMLEKGQLIPELSLTTSHDGTKAFQFEAGLYRCVCSNQMTVSDSAIQRLAVKHMGYSTQDVIEASYKILADVPRVAESVEAMKAVELSAAEREAFSEAAILTKWDSDQAPILYGSNLLSIRRWDDKKSDLWSTFNVVQENLIKGGLRGRNESGRKVTTRSIKSIDEDRRVNKALWSLAENMRRIKNGEPVELVAS